MGVRTSQLYKKGRTKEYRHIGAQDISQVIWQSGDRGTVGSGDKKGEGKRKGKRYLYKVKNVTSRPS